MTATVMSLSLCFSNKTSSTSRLSLERSAEPEYDKFVHKHSSYCRRRWSRKKKAGTEVWFGQSSADIPPLDVGDVSAEVFTSYSGPDTGLAAVRELTPVDDTTGGQAGDGTDANSNSPPPSEAPPPSPRERLVPPAHEDPDIAGAHRWNVKSRKAYGISMSLYEQHPINGKISGEPIADSFGVCARKNSAVMIVADGVNWGEKSRIAARCAVYGAMRRINKEMFGDRPMGNTHDAFRLLLSAVDCAHDTILTYGGGQTTLCLALVLPLRDSRQYAICIVNVGDSLAYVFSKYHGIREITTGSHDIQTERDIRDAGGAVGPVHGNDPELHNLTCSMTVADPGDIVYLTTDGISDNFDPVVTKIAVAKRRYSNPELQTLPEDGAVENGNDRRTCGTLDGKPEMEPHERHQYAVKEMERIIHEFELFTEQPCSAQELCGALLQHVLKLTDPKRKVLENPDLYGKKKMKSKDRKRRDSEIIAKLSKSPGKLDHATIIGFEVGVYHGDDDEDYEIDEVSEDEMEAENVPPEAQFNFEDGHFADEANAEVNKLSLKHGHNSQDVACAPPSHKHSLTSPSAEHGPKKHAKGLKNFKVKIRKRFKSPGRSRNRSDRSTSPERSPSKSPGKPHLREQTTTSPQQYSENGSAPQSPVGPPPDTIIPEMYMIKGRVVSPIASENEDESGDKSQTITYILPEIIPYGIDLEDISFIDDNQDGDQLSTSTTADQ